MKSLAILALLFLATLACSPANAQCPACPEAVVWSDTQVVETVTVTETKVVAPVRGILAAKPARRAVSASGRLVRGVGRVALAPLRLLRCRR